MDAVALSAGSGLTLDEATTVVDFVNAVNSGNLASLVNLFAQDAHVNDQLRNFWGLDSIAAWLKEEVVGERLRLTFLSTRKHYDTTILSAEVQGDFDSAGLPQPMVVDFYFTARGNKIVRLLILVARNDSAEPEVRRSL